MIEALKMDPGRYAIVYNKKYDDNNNFFDDNNSTVAVESSPYLKLSKLRLQRIS